MKRIISILTAIVMCVALVACGSSSGNPNEGTVNTNQTSDTATETTPEPTPEATPEPEKKTAYEITYSKAATYKNSIGTVWVQAIFEVENTGDQALYMSSGTYDLEDMDGKLVKSSSMVSVFPTVIEPGEKAYYYEETTLDDMEDAVELNIVPRAKAEKAKVDNIKFPVTDFSIKDDTYGLKMLGRVENTTDEEQSMVYIAAVLFDANDVPIGQIFTILMEDFMPDDKIGFEGSTFTLPKEVTAESVARYEVFAYPMQMQF